MKLPRKSFVTHKKFQYGFVLCLGIFGGLLALLNYWIQIYITQHSAGKTMLMSMLTVGGALILVCAPVVLASLIFTNRIAGPLLRLQRHMESAASGDVLSDFKFREKDFFRNLEGPYNRILEKLRTSQGS